MITVPPPVETQGKKGRPPNVFVDEATFNSYKKRMYEFTMETAFAQLAETREVALAVGQVSVAEKIVHDTAQLFGANIRKDRSVKGTLIDHNKRKRHRTPSYIPLTQKELQQEDAYARLEELRIEAAVKHKMETSRRTLNDIFRFFGYIPGKITTLDSISENDAALSRKINADLKEKQAYQAYTRGNTKSNTQNNANNIEDNAAQPPDPRKKRINELTEQIRKDEALYEKAKTYYAVLDAAKASTQAMPPPNPTNAANPNTPTPPSPTPPSNNSNPNTLTPPPPPPKESYVMAASAVDIAKVADIAKANVAKLEKRLIMLEEKRLPLKFADYDRLDNPVVDIMRIAHDKLSNSGASSFAETEKDLLAIKTERELTEQSFARRHKSLDAKWHAEYYMLHLNYRRCEYRLKYEDKETRARREACGLSLFTPFHLFCPPDMKGHSPPHTQIPPDPTNSTHIEDLHLPIPSPSPNSNAKRLTPRNVEGIRPPPDPDILDSS